MASRGHPSNTLDMIKHEPTCFKIALRLHLFTKSQPLPSPSIDILKRNIFSAMFRKSNILNVITTFLNFKTRILSMYPFLSEWCLNNTINFLTLGEHNVVNLSITWCSLSPFKNSIRPSPSSLNKCSTIRFCLLPLLLLTSWLMGCKKPPHWNVMSIWTKMNSLIERNQNVTNWFVITCN